mgnify:CR=1 FL=1|tara:strand:+ start:25451 stop:25831 length:381 start_codon:yes stop_codon:yes gene_type:complete
MHTLQFKSEHLTKLAKGTIKNMGKPFDLPYTEETTEDCGFMLVKDGGIYVMNAYDVGPAKNNLVAYADGYEPVDAFTYDPSNYVSEDDFAVFVPIPRNFLEEIASNGAYVELGLLEEEIRIRLKYK